MQKSIQKFAKCKVNECGKIFINENFLKLHLKKHHVTLNLNINTNINKSDEILSTDDQQTPTPTRLIRNCEEVGLFDDLQKDINPFDETFRRAIESSKLTSKINDTTTISKVEVTSCIDNQILSVKTGTGTCGVGVDGDDDESLHTPCIIPYSNNIDDESIITSTALPPITISSDEILPKKRKILSTNSLNLKNDFNSNSIVKSTLNATTLPGTLIPVTTVVHSINTNVKNEKIVIQSEQFIDNNGYANGNNQIIVLPVTTFPITSLATLTSSESSSIMTISSASLPLETKVKVHKVLPIQKTRRLLPTTLKNTQPSSLPYQLVRLTPITSSTITATTTTAPVVGTTSTAVTVTTPILLPTSINNTGESTTKEISILPKPIDHLSVPELLLSAPSVKDKLKMALLKSKSEIKKQKELNHNNNINIGNNSMNKVNISNNVNKISTKQSKLQANKTAAAAAKRYRNRIKHRFNELQRENLNLMKENKHLKKEVSRMEALLLAHQNCEITKEMSLGKSILIGPPKLIVKSLPTPFVNGNTSTISIAPKDLSQLREEEYFIINENSIHNKKS